MFKRGRNFFAGTSFLSGLYSGSNKRMSHQHEHCAGRAVNPRFFQKLFTLRYVCAHCDSVIKCFCCRVELDVIRKRLIQFLHVKLTYDLNVSLTGKIITRILYD